MQNATSQDGGVPCRSYSFRHLTSYLDDVELRGSSVSHWIENGGFITDARILPVEAVDQQHISSQSRRIKMRSGQLGGSEHLLEQQQKIKVPLHN